MTATRLLRPVPRPRSRRVALAGVALTAVLLAGCGSAAQGPGVGPTSEGATTAPVRPSDPGSDQEDGVTADGVPDRVLEAVLAAASDHAGVDPGDVAVVRAQRVTFRDGSLDCPEPGRQYTQALVDGYWVVVEAGGASLDYRLARQGEPRLCVGGRTPTPPADV